MATDSAAVLSGQRRVVYPTASVRDPELIDSAATGANRAMWDRMIDSTLIEWVRGTAAMEDDGFVPPTPEVISRACEVAMALRDQGWVAPTRIVPDGEGGIAFEHIDGDSSVSLSIHADESVEILTFEDCRLSGRRHLR